MKVLVISDIHANLNALDAVLDKVGLVDAVWCLGDLVGYGPDPNECIDRVKSLPQLKCVIGNHDAAALRRIDAESFNPEAKNALLWTQKALSESSLRFLAGLPETIEIGAVTLTHGSPRQPVWEYLLDAHTAALNFQYFYTPFCFVGHTHLPVIYQQNNPNHTTSINIPRAGTSIPLVPRLIINPGSVGQPRDRDPRASFAIFDTDNQTWDFQRVTYDISSVQHRMKKAGLPERHIVRLDGGW